MSHPAKGFAARKASILAALAVPDSEYTDLSPKGSVDAGIRELIADINRLDGLVTTSSCAGRISVFLEGSKKQQQQQQQQTQSQHQQQVAVPGGKGMGGRWLFVSHDPIALPLPAAVGEQASAKSSLDLPLHRLFNLTPQPFHTSSSSTPTSISTSSPSSISLGVSPSELGQNRLVRFQFEPMILHVLASSLAHAQRILAAALSAGFRESGLQSLRDCPMVAIRTAGLGLESVIGFLATEFRDRSTGNRNSDNSKAASEDSIPMSLVTEDYLRLMITLANRRFSDNAARIARLRTELQRSFNHVDDPTASTRDVGHARETESTWEDKAVRADRKRREGLEKQRQMRTAAHGKAKQSSNTALDPTDPSPQPVSPSDIMQGISDASLVDLEGLECEP